MEAVLNEIFVSLKAFPFTPALSLRERAKKYAKS